MKKVTQKEFREAMVIVETYCEQLHKAHVTSSAGNTDVVGSRVKLSAWGIEMQGKRKAKLIGTVVDWLDWHSTPTFKDGLTTVKWDGKAKPDTMHISHLEVVK